MLLGTKRHTNTARVTMVAIRDGKPFEVPRLLCESREDKIRFLEGKLRRELRVKQVQERDKVYAIFNSADDRELDRLLLADRLS